MNVRGRGCQARVRSEKPSPGGYHECCAGREDAAPDAQGAALPKGCRERWLLVGGPGGKIKISQFIFPFLTKKSKLYKIK